MDETDYKATHTTPDSVSINKYLNAMIDAGVDYCFMEVSSHGIHQKRIAGLSFAGGIFTNLSHDHLDYHKTFAEYRDVKKAFLMPLPTAAFALNKSMIKMATSCCKTRLQKIYLCFKNGWQIIKQKLLKNNFQEL